MNANVTCLIHADAFRAPMEHSESRAAMEAGVTDTLWSYEDVISLLEGATEETAVDVAQRRKDLRDPRVAEG